MGSDRSAPGRRSWAGGPFSGRETAARPWLLPLLLVLLDCLGRCAAAEDAEVHVAEVRTPRTGFWQRILGLGEGRSHACHPGAGGGGVETRFWF